MNSPTEIHSNSAIEVQVYHMLSCCVMSPFSTQERFRFQVKRICRDSSFVTLMSFGDKLPCQPDLSVIVSDPTVELSPAIIFATVIRTAKPYVT